MCPLPVSIELSFRVHTVAAEDGKSLFGMRARRKSAAMEAGYFNEKRYMFLTYQPKRGASAMPRSTLMASAGTSIAIPFADRTELRCAIRRLRNSVRRWFASAPFVLCELRARNYDQCMPILSEFERRKCILYRLNSIAAECRATSHRRPRPAGKLRDEISGAISRAVDFSLSEALAGNPKSA